MDNNVKLFHTERKMRLCRGSYPAGLNTGPYPTVILKGFWFSQWGFNPGDQITLTYLEQGALELRVTKTCEVVEQEKQKHKQAA